MLPLLTRVRLRRPTLDLPRFWDAARFALVVAVAAYAVAGVFPFADSSNDGSRLAGHEAGGRPGPRRA